VERRLAAENQNIWGKACPSAIFATTESTCSAKGLIVGLLGEKPMTNCTNHDSLTADLGKWCIYLFSCEKLTDTAVHYDSLGFRKCVSCVFQNLIPAVPDFYVSFTEQAAMKQAQFFVH
jgi:hypothetical protein